MEEPENYSYETMKEIVDKYKEKVTITNKGKVTLEDHTVIFILSESFVDPLRIPSLELSDDPIPYIRSLKNDAKRTKNNEIIKPKPPVFVWQRPKNR